MNAQETRAELQLFITQLETHKREFIRTLNDAIAELVGKQDSLALAAADEIGAVRGGGHAPARQVRYNVGGKLVTTEQAAAMIPPKLAPGKRACGDCGFPGHRAGNPKCTNPKPKKK